MSNISEDSNPEQEPEREPTVLERLEAAFPGLRDKLEPKPTSRPAPQWIVDWNLDLADRMFRGEFISREEIDALALAMGRPSFSPEEARAVMEAVFGMSAEQAIIKLQQRNN